MVELVDYCVLIRKAEELDACFGSLKEKRICFEMKIPRKRSNLPKLHDQIFHSLHEKQWAG